MTKLKQAYMDGTIYYKDGTLEDLLKVMDEVADVKCESYQDKDLEFQWMDYEFLTDTQNKEYENGTLWQPMNKKLRCIPLIPENVRNRKYVIFSFTNGKYRFGCYNGKAKHENS